MLGVAVIFYQLHGISYFDFGWPITAGFKQKSYNLMKSPLFLTMAGSGMIMFALLNFYKNNVLGGSRLPLPKPQPQPPKIVMPPKKSAVLPVDQAERKEAAAEVRAVLPKEVAGRVDELVSKISDEDIPILCNQLNKAAGAKMIEPTTRKALMNFFNNPKSFFSIFFFLSEIPDDKTYGTARTELIEIYAILHLLAMMLQKDKDKIKRVLQITDGDIADYILVHWDRPQAYNALQILMDKKSLFSTNGITISLRGEKIIGVIDKLLWQSYDPVRQRRLTQRSQNARKTDRVNHRLHLTQELLSLQEYLHAHSIAEPDDLTQVLNLIFSDKWIEILNIVALIATYDQACHIFDKQGGREAKDKDNIFQNIVKKLAQERKERRVTSKTPAGKEARMERMRKIQERRVKPEHEEEEEDDEELEEA